MTRNPIDLPCINGSCQARPGQACTTVGGFTSATAHSSRIKAALGDPMMRTDQELREAQRAYTRRVLAQLLTREPTDDEIDRAQRDGSLKPDKGWLRALIDDVAPQRLRLPARRVDQHGTVTLWGTIAKEVKLPSGGYIIELDSGELVRLSAAAHWDTWWPERKREAAHFVGTTPRYQFTIAKNGECGAISFEPSQPGTRRTPANTPKIPTPAPAQGELL